MSKFDELVTEEVKEFISATMDSDVYSNSELYNELTKILKEFTIVLRDKIFLDMSKVNFEDPLSLMDFRAKWGDLE